jgi:hypothetical protein
MVTENLIESRSRSTGSIWRIQPPISLDRVVQKCPLLGRIKRSKAQHGPKRNPPVNLQFIDSPLPVHIRARQQILWEVYPTVEIDFGASQHVDLRIELGSLLSF